MPIDFDRVLSNALYATYLKSARDAEIASLKDLFEGGIVACEELSKDLAALKAEIMADMKAVESA